MSILIWKSELLGDAALTAASGVSSSDGTGGMMAGLEYINWLSVDDYIVMLTKHINRCTGELSGILFMAMKAVLKYPTVISHQLQIFLWKQILLFHVN